MKNRYIIRCNKEQKTYYVGWPEIEGGINKAEHLDYNRMIRTKSIVKANGWEFVELNNDGKLTEISWQDI